LPPVHGDDGREADLTRVGRTAAMRESGVAAAARPGKLRANP